MLQVTHPTCEFRVNPLGIDTPQPRLSWVLESSERGQGQSAYQILVAGRLEDLTPGRADLWDSGKVLASESVAVAYAGEPLTSGQQCCWTVRAWDRHDQPSEWSAPASWLMGLLGSADWQGLWISAPTPRDVMVDGLTLPPCPHLRRSFTLDRPVARATLSVTARGVYEMRLNGARVGDAVLTPGWTDYARRIAYQTYRRDPSASAGRQRPGGAAGGRLVLRLCRVRTPPRPLRRPPAAAGAVEYRVRRRRAAVGRLGRLLAERLRTHPLFRHADGRGI